MTRPNIFGNAKKDECRMEEFRKGCCSARTMIGKLLDVVRLIYEAVQPIEIILRETNNNQHMISFSVHVSQNKNAFR